MRQDYDIIIIGAGSAGCVLAERLSRDPKVSVLLVEAGGWDRNPLITLPLGARKLFQYRMHQWGDFSIPDRLANDQRMEVPHGKVVGGTSSLNFMAACRGHREDFDRWATAGAEGWKFADLLPYFREIEDYRQGDLRGLGGPVRIRQSKLTDPIAEGWFTSARELGLPINDDYNGPEQEGFSPIQYSASRGRRYSSSRAFLRPALSRRNLDVLTNSHCERLILSGARVTGVSLRHRRGPREVKGRNVIVSAGAINTPHLLLLSGIGPSAQLQEFGIPTYVDLPVGQGLQDHVAFPMIWRRPHADPFHLALRFDRIGINMLRALLLRSGPAAEMAGGIMAFLKTQPTLVQPDFQLVIPMISGEADLWLPFRRPTRGSFVVKVNLLSQQSRGEVRLGSADPYVRPVIDYRTFSATEDIETLKRAYAITERLCSAAGLAPFREERVLPTAHLDETEIDAFIRANSFQQYHPACTCSIGSVTNPDLSVKGVHGLHIVDASVMPHLVSGNPNIVIMAMAAKAAVTFKAKFRDGQQ